MRIPESELILNDDGSIYHLHLLPEDIAETIFTVGDPERVGQVSQYFDHIELKKQKREFITHTGYIGNKRLTVLSTGMSTDNIDIVFNELDALVNIDLQTRLSKTQTKQLKIIRIGTAGGLQPTIPLDSFVVSEYAIGLDGLANFYPLDFNATEKELQQKFSHSFENDIHTSYAISADKSLVNLFSSNEFVKGTTVTCAGFYGPQGRKLRVAPSVENFTQRLTSLGMSNFEMETAGMYATGRMLGHQCCSVSAIVADRVTGKFSQKAAKTVDQLIQSVLGLF